MTVRRAAGSRLLIGLAGAGFVAVASTRPSVAAEDRLAGLSEHDCAGEAKGHVVRWYSLGSSPFATIPLRCGARGEFGLLKILGKRPELAPTLDVNIADALMNFDREQQQPPTSVAYSKTDLPPCPGHFRVVVQFDGYGASGMKGIITAFYSDRPAPGHPRVPDARPDIVRAAQESCQAGTSSTSEVR